MGVGLCFSSSPSPRLKHKQLGFSWKVNLEVWTELAEEMMLGMPLFLSQVAFKLKVQGHIPWPSPHHIPGDQRHIWTLPLISFPVPVTHCPVPIWGKPLSKPEELQVVGPSPPWPHPAPPAPSTNPQVAAQLPPNPQEASGSRC